MGQVLHGGARTTEAIGRATQLRQERVRAAAKRYGISPTTVRKWRDRRNTADAHMGPKAPRSPVLTSEEEAIIVAFGTGSCRWTSASMPCSRAFRI